MITDGYGGYWWLRTAMSVYGWLQVFTSDYDVLTDGYRWLQVVGGGSVWLWGGNRWLRVVYWWLQVDIGWKRVVMSGSGYR